MDKVGTKKYLQDQLMMIGYHIHSGVRLSNDSSIHLHLIKSIADIDKKEAFKLA